MSRHNLSISDELWAKVQKAAAEEGAKRGKPMPVSEWLRGLIIEKISGIR